MLLLLRGDRSRIYNYTNTDIVLYHDGTLNANLTFTRAQPNTAYTSALQSNGTTYSEYTVDTPRIWGANLDLVLEGPSKNFVKNPRAVGASGATPPTTWSVAAAPAGLTFAMTANTVNGIPGLMLTATGTTSSSGSIALNGSSTTTDAAAAVSGETWTVSGYFQIFDDTPVLTTITPALQALTAAGAGVTGDTQNANNMSSGRLSFNRFSATKTFANGTTAACRARLTTNSIGAGTSCNLRMFLGGWQLEKMAFPTSPIYPNTGITAVSERGVEALSAALADLDLSTNMTFLGKYTVNQQQAVDATLISVHNGTTGNSYSLHVESSSNNVVLSRVASGVTTTNTAGSVAFDTVFKCGITIHSNGHVLACLGGTSAVQLSGGNAVTHVNIGSNVSNADPLHGRLDYMKVMMTALSGADLETAVNAL